MLRCCVYLRRWCISWAHAAYMATLCSDCRTLAYIRSGAGTEDLSGRRLSDTRTLSAGAYLVDCKITEPSKIVSDREAIEKLWEVTKEQIAAKRVAI